MIEILIFSISFSIAVNIMLQPDEFLGLYGKLLGRLPFWIAKPFGECVKCFGGQVALWSYLILNNSYNFTEHITIISITIITGYIWENYAK